MKSGYVVVLVVAVLAVLAVGSSAVVWLTDWIWLHQIGYSGILMKSLGYRWLAGLSVGIITFVLVCVNVLAVGRSFRRLHVVDVGPDGRVLQNRWAMRAAVLVSAAIAVFCGIAASDKWLQILGFLNARPFAVNDPLHGLDVSFYVFRLPLLHSVYSFALSLLTVVVLLVCGGYMLAGSVSLVPGRVRISPRPLAHVAILVSLLFLIRAAGYRLDIYELVYSTRGMIYGAGYTDVKVIALGYNVLTAVAVAAAAAVLVDAATRRLRFLLPSIVGLIVVSVVFSGVVPGIVERFMVRPNQAQLEAPYIENHIQMTREAYGLAGVAETTFPAGENLTAADLEDNEDVISNVRLWDWRPLLDVYAQTQSNKAYYEFDEVDVDRYFINGRYRQVMLSGREMNPERVPGEARNWINRHLVYTHGYGLVMSYATEISDGGFPVYAVEGLPPRSEPGLEIHRPQIYYGEKTNDYVIVNNNHRGVGEFDYPAGDENAYIKYDGTGGIQLSSPLVKALFALRFASTDILLSDAVTRDSRIMVYRNIAERVRRIAPFFRYDRDPYLVLHDARLYWIMDAYTTTGRYPYSQPYPGWGNYVRNSVKVVIDAYHGSVMFFRWDRDDPIALLYETVFPGLFADLDELPDGLETHFRYAEDLFTVQAQILSIYHMTDVSVFYNKEDQWRIPLEQYQGATAQMQPYYMVTRMPGGESAEYVLMVPYSPVAKSNMTAILVGGCDGDNYGSLTLLRLPKGQTIRGPMQIENLIDGDDEISKDLTLWNQQGSRVIRGNLLVVPVENSLLYVEPIFLEPEGAAYPVLKRVAVSYAGRVVAGRTLEEGLSLLFDRSKAVVETERRRDPVSRPEDEDWIREVLEDESTADEALRLFNEARDAIQRNDWALYGRKLQELEETLNRLVKESKAD
jgi:uncharacterized membrane protein (UPF0182 family)